MMDLPTNLKLVNTIMAAAIAVFLLSSLLMVSAIDDPVEEALRQLDSYCAGVDAYVESGGAYGWPDYKDDYIPHCVERATKK